MAEVIFSFPLVIYFIVFLFRSSSTLAYLPEGTHYGRGHWVHFFSPLGSFLQSTLIYLSKGTHYGRSHWWFISDFFYFVSLCDWQKRNALRQGIKSLKFWFIFDIPNFRFSAHLDQGTHYGRDNHLVIYFRFLLFCSCLFWRERTTVGAIGERKSLKVYSVFTLQWRQLGMLWQVTLRSKNLIKRSKNLRGDSVGFANAMAVMIAS